MRQTRTMFKLTIFSNAQFVNFSFLDSLHDNTSMLAITHSRLYSPHGSEMLTKAQIVCPDANVPGNLQLLVQGAPYPIPC